MPTELSNDSNISNKKNYRAIINNVLHNTFQYNVDTYIYNIFLFIHISNPTFFPFLKLLKFKVNVGHYDIIT